MNHHSTLKINKTPRVREYNEESTAKGVSGIYTISFKLRFFIGYSTDLHREREKLLRKSNGIPYDLLCCGGTYRILEVVEDGTSIAELRRLRDFYVEWLTEELEDRRILY